MEFVTPIVTPIVESLLLPVKRHFDFLVSSSKNVRDMHARMIALDGTARDMHTKQMANNAKGLAVPHHVHAWLAEVEQIKSRVEEIPIEGVGCSSIKMRYKIGKQSSDVLKVIDRLMQEKAEIVWSDERIPLAMVTSPRTSIIDDDNQNIIESRDLIFNDAFKSLESNNRYAQKMALCGMAGIGKTTMMEQLEKAAKDRKMFDWIIKLNIGQNPNLVVVQQTVAEYLGEALIETTEDTRAKSLEKRFEMMSEKGKKKILVILDDVWEKFDLKCVGLTSPLKNGFKLLLTTRDESVCIQMGVESSLIFKIAVLNDQEAQKIFWETASIGSHCNIELHQIGDTIIKRCGGLPIAVKTIASTLRDKEEKDEWEDALSRLQNKEFDDYNIKAIFKMSYKNLKEDDLKAIFLLCGLFPEDYNIGKENLLRYGWGLKLFNNVHTIAKARSRVNTCVNKLIRLNLLIKGEHEGCVKMHDMVRDFVLSKFSDVKQASIVNHNNNVSKQLKEEESYERILLRCAGMFEFPIDFNYPNLALLKLMDGDNLLKFPEDLYTRMKKLEVVAYENMHRPLLPQYLTNIRALSLRSCSLVGVDISFLGDLISLEVLCLAYCGIIKLPSKFGQLKNLKLLDLTQCGNLHIDNGVFQNMEKLEELYMMTFLGQTIWFTDTNWNELMMVLRKLSALELEVLNDKTQSKHVSFENLERFRISMGCPLRNKYYKYPMRSSLGKKSYEDPMERTFKWEVCSDEYSFKNTLDLATSTSEIHKCKINKLFRKTEILSLKVNDMTHIEDVSTHPPQQSFCNLTTLDVHYCASLEYLFTFNVAKGLTRLESLKITSCSVLKAIVNGDNSEGHFEEGSTCSPQHPFCNLKSLDVSHCASLEHLFTVSVAKWLTRLESLKISSCSILKAMVNSENSEGEVITFQKLNFMYLYGLAEFVSLCDPVNTIVLPQLVELELNHLPNVTSIFPGNDINLAAKQTFLNKEVVIPKLEKLTLRYMTNVKGIWACEMTSNEEKLNNISMLSVSNCHSLVNLFPCNPMRLLSHLETLVVRYCDSIEALFNIDLGKIKQPCSNNSLRLIEAENLKKLTEVWKIKDVGSNYSSLFGGFQSFETLNIMRCERFRNIFMPTTFMFNMRALKDVNITQCGQMGQRNNDLVKNNQEPKIDTLSKLGNTISTFAFTSSHITHNFHSLRNIRFSDFKGMDAVFDIESPSTRKSVTTQQPLLLLPDLEHIDLSHMGKLSHVWKCSDWNALFIRHENQPQSSFKNLTTIHLTRCNSIRYLFSPLMMKHLYNLKKVWIICCDGMEEVVSNIDGDDKETNTSTTSTSVNAAATLLPHLDILELSCMPSLKHIDGGVAKFSQADVVSSSLCQYSKKIDISYCDALSCVIPSYVAGQMQKLQVLSISHCKSMVEVFETREVKNNNLCGRGSSSTIAIPRPTNCTMHKFPNLKILTIEGCKRLKNIFMFSTLESLKILERLTIRVCKEIKVIVKEEAPKDTSTSLNEVVFPHLKSIELERLPNLAGFFLGMHIEFKWPLLEYVMINECPRMIAFTSGTSTTPRLKYITTELGKHNLEDGLNFRMTPTLHEVSCSSLEGISSYSHPTISDGKPWSFSNMIECRLKSYQNCRKIFTSNEFQQLQKLEKVHVESCDDVEEIFEAASEVENNESQTVVKFPKLRELNTYSLRRLEYIWKSNKWRTFEFPNLTRLSISSCSRLEHVFTCSMVGSVMQLQELSIKMCENMKVIVKEEVEDYDTKVSEIKFPCLKSLTLFHLESLKGFSLGKEDFTLPSLDTFYISQCPEIIVFTKGRSVAPKLKLIRINTGPCYVEEDINSFVKTKKQEGCFSVRHRGPG